MTDEPMELSSEARTLIGRAEGGDDPSPGDRARVRRGLMAAVAGGAGLAATSAASSAAASAAGTGVMTSLVLKIAVVVLVVGAVGGTVVVAPWEEDAPSAAVSPSRAGREQEPRSGAVSGAADVAATDLIEAAGVAEPEAELAEPAPEVALPTLEDTAPPALADVSRPAARPLRLHLPVEPAPMVAPGQTAPAPVATEPPSAPAVSMPPPSTLAAEVALLRSAQAALSGGDPEVALGRLAEHARRYPDGAMAEERDAARVLALCRAGRADDARAAAARFLRERPQSPLAARVRASCE